MNALKKMFIKSVINEKKIKIIIDLFAIGIYADEIINRLEISQAQRDIENFVNKYYFFLKDLKRKWLSEYIYEKVIEKVNMERNQSRYIDYLLKEFEANIKFINDEELKKFLLILFEDILKSDKIYTKEEKEYYQKIKKILKVKE
jgi:hypothetical protein